MTKNLNKPTGKLGAYRVSLDKDKKPIGVFEKISFPKEKQKIEENIVSKFIYSVNKEHSKCGKTFPLSNPSINEQDDFDFNVLSPKGLAYLELMEIAPLECTKGGYSQAPKNYRPYDLAEEILRKITNKSEKYPKNLDRELFLLLYVTNWTFILNQTTIALLRCFCAKKSMIFKAIFSYVPIDDNEGDVRWIFPVPPELIKGLNPEKYRNNLVFNFNPENFKLNK